MFGWRQIEGMVLYDSLGIDVAAIGEHGDEPDSCSLHRPDNVRSVETFAVRHTEVVALVIVAAMPREEEHERIRRTEPKLGQGPRDVLDREFVFIQDLQVQLSCVWHKLSENFFHVLQ